MKRVLLFCFLSLAGTLFAQQASSYFPAQLGYVWHFKTSPLDSLNHPVDSLTIYEIDSLAVQRDYKGQLAYHIVSKSGPVPGIYTLPYIDTSYINFVNSDAKQYFGISNLDSIAAILHNSGLDTLFGGFNLLNTLTSFQKWYPMFKFASNVNTSYTVFQYDTTVTIQTQTVPLRFLLKGKRTADQSVTVPAGTFACKVFAMEFSMNYVVDLPPPLPDIVVPLLTMPDSLFFAPGMWVVKDIMPSTKFDLAQFGFGAFNIPGSISVLVPKFVSAAGRELMAETGFSLEQNFPNPFNPATRIGFSLKSPAFVKLTLYNSRGEEVCNLMEGEKAAGTHSIDFRPASLAAGVYFYTLRTGNFVQNRKMVYLK